MAVTQFRAAENTVLQSLGGTLAADVEKDIVVEWVSAIEPWETPLLTMVQSNDEFSQQTHQWGQSYRIDTTTFVNDATGLAATDTAVVVDDSDIFQVGMVIQIADPMTGTTDVPDLTNAENVLVTAITAGTHTLTTTALANAHVDNAIVTIVGTAEEMNSEHTEAPRQRGTQFFNYPQRFAAQLTADIRAQNMPTWEHPTNPLLSDFAEEMKKQKLLLERAIYAGTRVAENTTNGVPGRFGGLRQYITTNAVNMSGAVLTSTTLEDALVDLWYEAGASAGTTWVMSLKSARVLDALFEPTRQATPTSTELTNITRTYRTRAGDINIMPTRECPESEIWLIKPEYIKLRPFKGANWHVSEKAGKDHAVDHDVKAISGDFTLEVHNEHAMARVYNFDTRIASY